MTDTRPDNDKGNGLREVAIDALRPTQLTLGLDEVERRAKAMAGLSGRELRTLLPWVDWNAVQFATFTVQRAEARQADGRRPSGPGVFRDGRVIAAWPTKMALAPLLARQIEALLPDLGMRPRPRDLSRLADWPRPALGVYPWDREDLEWS